MAKFKPEERLKMKQKEHIRFKSVVVAVLVALVAFVVVLYLLLFYLLHCFFYFLLYLLLLGVLLVVLLAGRKQISKTKISPSKSLDLIFPSYL